MPIYASVELDVLQKKNPKIIMQQEKKVINKKFDVLNVINKTYADSSEYDLNDTLIYLSKVLTQTKNKNKELVKSNFSKFVECRIVLEDILEDIKSKGLDKEFSSDIFTNIKYIKNNFKLCIKEGDALRERKLMIMHKYKILFDIQNLLKQNFDKLERFVEIYKKGRDQYNEVKKSKYIQNIWESIKDIKYQFLDKLYNQIIDDKNNYMEVLYIFDLYFQVSEDKTDRKIMNTLLVNYKEKCLNISFTNKGLYLKDISYYFLRTIFHLDKELQKELIIYMFDKIKTVFSMSSFEFIRIWIYKLNNFIPDNLDLEVKSVYDVNLKSLKKYIVDKFLDKRDLFESFTKLRSILDSNEIHLLNHKLLNIIEEESKNINFNESEEIEEYFKEFNKFEEFLEDEIEDFKDLKRNILSSALKQKIKSLGSFLTNNNNKHKKLMEIIRLVDKLPEYYEIILKGIIPVISKDYVILYYVSSILKIEQPELNDHQKNEIQSLNKQFEFLL